MKNNNGSWIFISHSSADIEKIRIIRNEFEKYGQNPLAFHLKCLNDNTKEGKEELFDLIKREIAARDWFVYCESESASKSSYVQMEREYVKKCNKQFIWMINLDQDVEEIKNQVRKICCSIQVFLVYAEENENIARPLKYELRKNDFSTWDIYEINSLFKEAGEAFLSIAKKGFVLFICTKESINNNLIIDELKQANANKATIITFVFDVTIPSSVSSLLRSGVALNHKQIYEIPAVPKSEDFYLLVDLIKSALERKIVGCIEMQADALNARERLQEKLNYNGHYHSEEAVCVGSAGAIDDYIEYYRFPCCGTIVSVGDGPISRFRADGCCKKN